MTHTLRFDEPLATRLELSGGKGANLSLLTQRGFPVPPGFIVTAPVYREFITGAGGWLRRVAALPFHDAAALRAASEALQAELSRLPLPPAAAAEIKEQLGRFPAGHGVFGAFFLDDGRPGERRVRRPARDVLERGGSGPTCWTACAGASFRSGPTAPLRIGISRASTTPRPRWRWSSSRWCPARRRASASASIPSTASSARWSSTPTSASANPS